MVGGNAFLGVGASVLWGREIHRELIGHLSSRVFFVDLRETRYRLFILGCAPARLLARADSSGGDPEHKSRFVE
jgi:hypothetical protein